MQAKELWNFKYTESILGIELGDINNNGELEIVACTRTGKLLFLTQNGKLIHQEIISKDKPIWHIKIVDIDKDGENELILGGMDGVLRTFKCNTTYDLEILWVHNFNGSISGILIEDINNDNNNEIIAFSLDKTIRILNPLDGSLIWGQIFIDGIGDATVFIKDKDIILAGGNDGTIRTFNSIDGKLIWVRQFSDKIRCVCYLNSIKGWVVLCGGDDKKLHFLNKTTHTEFKTIFFKDYVWKCVSYPYPRFNNAIISSYSFDYFDNSTPIKQIFFSSKIICIDEFLDIKWKLKGFNVECLQILDIYDKTFISIGTTKGEIIIIEEKTGRILLNKSNYSCLNSIQFDKDNEILYCSYDNGNVIAFKLEEI